MISLPLPNAARCQVGHEPGSVGGAGEAQAEWASDPGLDGLAGLSRKKSGILTWASLLMAPPHLTLFCFLPLGPPCQASVSPACSRLIALALLFPLPGVFIPPLCDCLRCLH